MPGRWPRTPPRLFAPGTRALTHCNAGGLATGGYGSAVGALLAAWERELLGLRLGRRDAAAAPGRASDRLGARAGGDPAFAVITDSTAASRMAAGEVDAVVTGADRIAANGDTANKIGTYGAGRARRPSRHPRSTSSRRARPSTTRPPAVTAIPIEERDPAEVTTRFPARNPAFDVTPAELITAIVTEHGVHRPPYADSLAGAVVAA